MAAPMPEISRAPAMRKHLSLNICAQPGNRQQYALNNDGGGVKATSRNMA